MVEDDDWIIEFQRTIRRMAKAHLGRRGCRLSARELDLLACSGMGQPISEAEIDLIEAQRTATERSDDVASKRSHARSREHRR